MRSELGTTPAPGRKPTLSVYDVIAIAIESLGTASGGRPHKQDMTGCRTAASTNLSQTPVIRKEVCAGWGIRARSIHVQFGCTDFTANPGQSRQMQTESVRSGKGDAAGRLRSASSYVQSIYARVEVRETCLLLLRSRLSCRVALPAFPQSCRCSASYGHVKSPAPRPRP